MRAYVITILDLPQSVEVAQRCIDSAWEHGVEVEMRAATTPKDDPAAIMAELGFSARGFRHNSYSREEPCIATFLSHSSLWSLCMDIKEPILILEHDAVFRAPLPDGADEALCCNLGQPSFGQFKTPQQGFGPLVSKEYFGGAHGYMVSPAGAKLLLDKAGSRACPTDVYLGLARFPWLTEYFPWPIVCDDSFSTIQKEKGCAAHHNEVHPL